MPLRSPLKRRRGPMRLLRSEPGHRHLAQLRDEGNLEALARYVDDPESSPRLRRRAVTYVASMKPGGGKAMTGVGPTDPTIVAVLAPLLEEDPDPAVRRAAAYGLRRTGSESAAQSLIHALSDSDKATRIHAVMGLGDLRSSAAVEPLSRLLDDRSCAGNAARALVEIGDKRALATLKNATSSAGSRWSRRKFAQAATDLEHREGPPPTQ
jgi:HEAT repeat protein